MLPLRCHLPLTEELNLPAVMARTVLSVNGVQLILMVRVGVGVGVESCEMIGEIGTHEGAALGLMLAAIEVLMGDVWGEWRVWISRMLNLIWLMELVLGCFWAFWLPVVLHLR